MGKANQGIRTVNTDSPTISKRPQFIHMESAWRGKAYIEGYVERIQSIRDAFTYQTNARIDRPLDFAPENTQYFWELQMLYSYGGFEWPTIFSHIKPRQ